MARTRTRKSRKPASSRRPARRARPAARGGRGASRIREAAAPVPPAPFNQVFTSYWHAIQSGQAAVLSATQKAYADMLKSFRVAWELESGRTTFTDACLRFTTAARARPWAQDAVTGEALEELYRAYVEELRDAWLRPELTEALEEGYLAYSEAVQKAADEAHQQAVDARKQYLSALREACATVDIEHLGPEALEALSRCLMVTVFFTDGVRPATA